MIDKALTQKMRDIAHGSESALVQVTLRAAAAALEVEADLERECEAVDSLLGVLGLHPDQYRTEGGAINLPKLRDWLMKPALLAYVDTRNGLGLSAPTEDDFPALYALDGHKVVLVDLGPNVSLSGLQRPARKDANGTDLARR